MTDPASIPAAVWMVLGGLAIFLHGMQTMTGGLRDAAGSKMRRILQKATRDRFRSYGLGSILGTGMHSSAASVMIVGFVNAGLLRLVQAVPMLYGINLGSTLAMQLVSFRFTDLAYAFLFVGLALQLVFSRGTVHHLGKTLLGFGMIFLGMEIMGTVLGGYREELEPFLTAIDGTHIAGMLRGILVAFAVTAVLQSSGAVIGMGFVMLDAGMMSSLAEVYPLILGAHVGTSVTGVLGSIGTNVEARRVAVANVVFNLFNLVLGVALAPWILQAVAWTSEDLVHQAANAHTGLRLLAGVALLPLVSWHVRLVERLLTGKEELPAASHLDPEALPMPETALRACLREFQRAVKVCRKSLADTRSLQEEHNAGVYRSIQLQENILNEIKAATRDYLSDMTRRYLSRRQALMVQYCSRINADIERIGDHIESMATLSRNRHGDDRFDLGETAVHELYDRIDAALQVLDTLHDGFHIRGKGEYAPLAEGLEHKTAGFLAEAESAISSFNQKVADHRESALTGLYFTESLLGLSRMVRHCAGIAHEMRQPFFGIKEEKLGREEPREREGESKREWEDSAHRGDDDLDG